MALFPPLCPSYDQLPDVGHPRIPKRERFVKALKKCVIPSRNIIRTKGEGSLNAEKLSDLRDSSAALGMTQLRSR
jgi:hypothetical protein